MSFAPQIRPRGSRQASVSSLSSPREGSVYSSEGTPSSNGKSGSPKVPLTFFSTKKSRAQQAMTRSKGLTEDPSKEIIEPLHTDAQQTSPVPTIAVSPFGGESVTTAPCLNPSYPEVQQVVKTLRMNGEASAVELPDTTAVTDVSTELLLQLTRMLEDCEPAEDVLQTVRQAIGESKEQKDLLGFLAALLVAMHFDGRQQSSKKSSRIWGMVTAVLVCTLVYIMLSFPERHHFVPV